MLGETLAAWIAFPIVAGLLALGLGLLVERLVGQRLGALRVPVGLCAAVCVTLASYWSGAPGAVAVLLVLVPAIAGLALERGELRRWRPSWFMLGFVAAYTLHLTPVVLSGEWTWTGYNFVNDTAVQMLLAEWLPQHAMHVTDMHQSTTTEVVRSYLDNAYPLGSHALLGTAAKLVPAPVPALYQPYIALLAAAASTALAHLAHRAGLSAPAAAATGVVAVGANLFYQYALQGNVKEIAFFMAFAAAAATGRELIASEQPLRASVAPALCFAAAFEIYSTAAAPYLVALAAALAALVFLRHERASVPSLARAGVALGAGALVLAAPGLAGAVTFNDIASNTFTSADRAADLGHLLRPLELIQAAGIWLTGDYRVPVPEAREALNLALCVVALVLALTGVAWSAARREPGPLLLAAATVAAAVYLLPKLSPYASGKVIALASPVVVFGAMLGCWAIFRRYRVPGLFLAGVVALAVMWSNAFAYHDVRVAPVERLNALLDAAEHVDHVRGPVLVNEPEEFAKVFNDGADFNVGSEAVTVQQVELRAPQGFQNLYFDLDSETLNFVQLHSALVKRRSPDASRPPANFRLTYANDWYEVWRRVRVPKVVEHMPLQDVHRAALVPACADVRALARRAREGEQLVAAPHAPTVVLDTVNASRARYWVHSWQPGMVVTQTPGQATAVARARQPGRYRAWVAGSFGRPIDVFVDRRKVGSVSGVNNLGQWLLAGDVHLNAGRHRLRLVRGGGDLSPGDGYEGELGPLMLERVGRASLKTVSPRQAAELCGRAWDWIERVTR